MKIKTSSKIKKYKKGKKFCLEKDLEIKKSLL